MLRIIGGAGRSGKSLLSRRLLIQAHQPYLSLDALKMGIVNSLPNFGLNPEAPSTELMVFPKWTKSSLGEWFFILLIIPLFWWMMFVVIGGMIYIIWLLAMALYIPLLLYVGGKIKLGNPTLPIHKEKLRRLVVWLGRIEFGMVLFQLYFFAFAVIIMWIYQDDLYFQ